MPELDLVKMINGILQGLGPRFSLINLEKVSDKLVEMNTNLNVTNNFAINLLVAQAEEIGPHIIVTQYGPSKDVAQQRSIAISPEQRDAPTKLVLQEAHYGSGAHIMINQVSWWTNQVPIRINQLSAFPIRINQSMAIDTLDNKTFKVSFASQNSLEIEIWEGYERHRIDLSSEENSLNIRNTSWIFKQFTPSQVITFRSSPEIVISLDKYVVQTAVVIERSRPLHPDEYYVLVASV